MKSGKFIKTKPPHTASETVEEAHSGSVYYPLFKHLSDEHGLTLLDSELQEIINIAYAQSTAQPSEKVLRDALEALEQWRSNVLGKQNTQQQAMLDLMSTDIDEETQSKCAAIWRFISGFKKDLQKLDEILTSIKKQLGE